MTSLVVVEANQNMDEMISVTDEDVDRYVAENDVIVNPLQYQGYPSIGCWPCTEPVLDGEDQRAGRWRGTGKTECGLHFS